MAASKQGKELKKQLSQRLKEALGQRASVELLNGYPDLLDQMGKGEPAPEVADVLTRKIIGLALDPHQKNQWAIELIYDRVEGRAATQQQGHDQGRAIDEQLDNVTAEHLNDLTRQFAEQEGGELAKSAASEAASGQVANPIMDLPQNRPGGSENAESES